MKTTPDKIVTISLVMLFIKNLTNDEVCSSKMQNLVAMSWQVAHKNECSTANPRRHWAENFSFPNVFKQPWQTVCSCGNLPQDGQAWTGFFWWVSMCESRESFVSKVISHSVQTSSQRCCANVLSSIKSKLQVGHFCLYLHVGVLCDSSISTKWFGSVVGGAKKVNIFENIGLFTFVLFVNKTGSDFTNRTLQNRLKNSCLKDSLCLRNKM